MKKSVQILKEKTEKGEKYITNRNLGKVGYEIAGMFIKHFGVEDARQITHALASIMLPWDNLSDEEWEQEVKNQTLLKLAGDD